eukprot:4044725-Prymnesium_polylepis.2
MGRWTARSSSGSTLEKLLATSFGRSGASTSMPSRRRGRWMRNAASFSKAWPKLSRASRTWTRIWRRTSLLTVEPASDMVSLLTLRGCERRWPCSSNRWGREGAELRLLDLPARWLALCRAALSLSTAI